MKVGLYAQKVRDDVKEVLPSDSVGEGKVSWDGLEALGRAGRGNDWDNAGVRFWISGNE
jgi:hypothetical protein